MNPLAQILNEMYFDIFGAYIIQTLTRRTLNGDIKYVVVEQCGYKAVMN